jgi:predicted membrane protein
LLAIDPVFEGGRSRKKARSWDVEDELTAVAFLGDVTIDLSVARSTPAEVTIEAYAILRDVDVLVPEGTQVQLGGGSVWGDLSDEVPKVSEDERKLLLHVHGHSLVGDVNVRMNRLDKGE